LKELARMMEQFGIPFWETAVRSDYVKYKGYVASSWLPSFDDAKDWQFAIAEVEGKPVFIGDELYGINSKKFIVKWSENFNIYGSYINGSSSAWCIDRCSWNPPKPKTIMVEHLLEDVQEMARTKNTIPMSVVDRLIADCAKALKESE
jgi:hypothetical protein